MLYIYGLILSLCACTFAVEGNKLNITNYGDVEIQAFRNVVARSVAEVVANSLRTYHGPVGDSPDGKATIYPPIEDPATLDPLNICGLYIQVPIPGANFSIDGDINLLNPVVSGMSKFVNDLEIAYIALTGALSIDLELRIPEVQLLSPYMADLRFSDGIGSIPKLVGEGELPFEANDLFFTLHAQGKAPLAGQFMNLDELNVDLGFKNLTFDPSGLTSQGRPVSLQNLANNLQRLFDTLWADDTKVRINEMTRCALDDLISECNIGLITSGGLECLKDEIKQECFGLGKHSAGDEFAFRTPVCDWLATASTTERTDGTTSVQSEASTARTTYGTSMGTTEWWTTLRTTTTEAPTVPNRPWPYPLVDIDIDINVVINNYNRIGN